MTSEYNRELGSLTEEEIVDLIASRLVHRPSYGEYLSYPDDARDILPRGPRIIMAMDAYTVKSLKLPWRSLDDVAWAAFTGPVSDVLVKGGIPLYAMIALGTPSEWKTNELLEFINGLREASSFYNIRVLGGDTNNSSEPWIAITVAGFTSIKNPPSRRGLKPGDRVIVTGVYGAMGYVVKHGFEEALKQEWVVSATKRPRARIEIGYLVSTHYRAITATMDVSDGLGYTLHYLSKLGGYGIKIEQPPLTHRELNEHCRENTRCILEYCLNGGEEYGVVMGVREEHVNEVVSELEYYGIEYSIVGRVVDIEPGIYFNGEKLAILRYDQFKGWS